MKKDKMLNTLSPTRRRFLKNLLRGALITGAAIVTANLRQKTAFARNQRPTSTINQTSADIQSSVAQA